VSPIFETANQQENLYLPILPGPGDLHVRAAGRRGGKPLLLFHGAGPDVTWRTWEPQMDAFGEVRRVYALDWPGWGQSAGVRPEGPDRFAPAPMIEVALRAMDTLDIPFADIGGCRGARSSPWSLRWPHRSGPASCCWWMPPAGRRMLRPDVTPRWGSPSGWPGLRTTRSSRCRWAGRSRPPCLAVSFTCSLAAPIGRITCTPMPSTRRRWPF
jgi:hypothetical protein